MFRRIVLKLLWVVLVLGLNSVKCRGEEAPRPVKEEEKSSCSSPNVRTVIFRQNDMDKECWSREEVALLFTRRMMQELLPKRKPSAVPLLIDYFKDCLETVKKLATSRRTHTLIVTALADTLGGYLQAFGIPMAHQAYYEGTLGYSGAKQLHDLLDAFKKLLRTDGGGWTKPTKMKRCVKVTPLRISKAPSGIDSCSCLVTRNELNEEKAGEVEILMPFLDDPTTPTAIALPFKDRNLYSLNSKCCANILVKYYSRAIWCLTQTYGTASLPETGSSHVPQVQNFFGSFNQWLGSYVLPHLKDPNFYPAFGSVLRIIETLSTKVKESKTIKERIFHRAESLPIVELAEECDAGDDQVTSRRFYILVISSLVIAFWIIVLIVYILYKWFSKRKDDECEDTSTVSSTEDEPSPEETSECDSATSLDTDRRKREAARRKSKKMCPT